MLETNKIYNMDCIDGMKLLDDNIIDSINLSKGNSHPCVKPISLLTYLCNLTKTPTGGIVLDLFGGSGSIIPTYIITDRPYIIFEKEAEYIPIIEARAKVWLKAKEEDKIFIDDHNKVTIINKKKETKSTNSDDTNILDLI